MSALLIRHREPWTDRELARLEHLSKLHLPTKQIARELGRKPQAVQQRKSRAALTHHPKLCYCSNPLPPKAGPGRPRVYCSTQCRSDLRSAYEVNDRLSERLEAG